MHAFFTTIDDSIVCSGLSAIITTVAIGRVTTVVIASGSVTVAKHGTMGKAELRYQENDNNAVTIALCAWFVLHLYGGSGDNDTRNQNQ